AVVNRRLECDQAHCSLARPKLLGRNFRLDQLNWFNLGDRTLFAILAFVSRSQEVHSGIFKIDDIPTCVLDIERDEGQVTESLFAIEAKHEAACRSPGVLLWRFREFTKH